jgi:hypothetical protein
MAGDYVQGQMEISAQENTYAGFMTATVWVSALVALSVLFLTLVFAAGQPWLGSLFGVAFLGIVSGMFFRLGGAWYGVVVALTVVALISGGITTAVSNLT